MPYLVTATWDDVPHLTEKQKSDLWGSIPAHERDARSKGIPTLGSGLIFPVAEEDIVVEPFALPRHWPQIGGMDFGYDHPFAAVKLAHDRDNDVIYVTAEYRKSQATPVIHAAALKPWGDWLPWAWPHGRCSHEPHRNRHCGKQLHPRHPRRVLQGPAVRRQG
jgi:Terminase RNaseH-like domain